MRIISISYLPALSKLKLLFYVLEIREFDQEEKFYKKKNTICNYFISHISVLRVGQKTKLL